MQDWFAISLLIIALLFLLIGFGCEGMTMPCKENVDGECSMIGYCCDEDSDCCPDGECEGGVCVEQDFESPNENVVGKVVCHLIEYDQPPNDDEGPPSQEEIDQLQELSGDIEDFRIHRNGGGGGGGGRRSGGGGGRRSGGGRHGRRSGGGRHGRRWRRWPRRHYARPWRSLWWRAYPYVYTYPLTYYSDYWEPPVERFSVRIGPKLPQHPFYGRGSDLGYMITQGTGFGCGVSGARLDLFYGRTYEFDIYTSQDCVTGQARDQPFFFTTDPNGGSANGALFNVTPTVNGTIRIQITNNLPKIFYYQSTSDPNVGGYVVLN